MLTPQKTQRDQHCFSMSQFSDDLDPNSTRVLILSLLYFPISPCLFSLAFLGHLSFVAHMWWLQPKNVSSIILHTRSCQLPSSLSTPSTLVQMSPAGAHLWTKLSRLIDTGKATISYWNKCGRSGVVLFRPRQWRLLYWALDRLWIHSTSSLHSFSTGPGDDSCGG